MAAATGPFPARPRGLRGVRSMSSLTLREEAASPPTFAETMQRYTDHSYPIARPNHNQHENNNDVFTGLAGIGTGITTPKKAVIVNRSIIGYPADLSRDSERRRPRPRPISSNSEISIDWSSNSEESEQVEGETETEEEDMQGQYASLEQLLARKGFRGGECRVMTPESHKLVTTINTSDTPKPRNGGPPSAPVQLPTSSLRAKSSILSLSGLVSSIWNGSITFTPFSGPPQDTASQANVAPPSPAQSGSSSDSDETTAADLSFEKDKEQTVSRWIKAAAASVEVSSCSSSSASTSSSYTSSRSGFVRTSMDSTIESIQIETPSTSPKSKNGGSGKAYIFHTARTAQDDGSMLSFEHKEEGQDTEERTAESLLREEGSPAKEVAPAPKAAPVKDKRPSLADIFSNTTSEESIRTTSSAGTDSPTPPASPSTVIALPRASSSASPVECEEVPISPITAINLADPIAKPAKAATRTTTTTTTTTNTTSSSSSAAGSQPKLLRKAKSLHSLRLAASPVLSTQDIVVAQPVREATPPPMPSLPSSRPMPRAPVPRSTKSSNTSSASSGASSTPKKGEYPRNVAHRNPRDSPIGETRVVKGISSSSSASPQRSRGVKAPSILDDLEDDMGLWTPPRKKSTSLRRTIHQNNLANDENTPPSSQQQQQQVRRPKLKAKESLECILSKGRDVEVNNNRAKQQVIQQTPAGRKALGQLSSFHRNPLPVPKKDASATIGGVEGKKKENIVQAPAATIVKKSSISSFSGTIKGFFGAATGWAEPSSPPRPISKTPKAPSVSTQSQPQAHHRPSHSPRKNGNNTAGSRHPSRRQIRSESIYHPDQLQNHSRGRSGEFAYTVNSRDGRNGGRAYQPGQSRSMILPTIVISDASSEYDDGVPL